MTDELNTWEQKKRFHAMVRDIQRHIPVWCGLEMDEEDWKRALIAGAHGQHITPNPFGEGFIVVNKQRVRGMLKPSMSDLIEQMFAFGNERGVEWSDPYWQALIAERMAA